MEMRIGPGRLTRDVAKRVIPGRVNSVLCRSSQEVFLTGEAMLLCGNARDGWARIAPLGRNQKAYCLAELAGTIYFAWCETANRSFGIMSWDGKKLRVVRDDLLPWHQGVSGGQICVTWINGFGLFNGKRCGPRRAGV